MIKYRPHRGGLSESMKEYKKFTDIANMLKYIANNSDGAINESDIVIGESQGSDERIGWKSWRYVCTVKFRDFNYKTPQCVGMCDLGEIP